MVLDEVYDLLRKTGLVSSESEFSESWLAHNESYLRTLRCRKALPSIGSIAICASRLQKAGEQMRAARRFKQLGTRFIEMSEKLHQQVNEQAVELELAN